MPILAKSLTDEQFGLYLTLTTVFAMLATLDFGLGGALLSQVSSAAVRDDRTAMQGTVSSAFFALAAASVGLMVVGTALILTVPLARLLGVSGTDDQTVRVASAIVVVATAVSLPIVGATKVLFGLHRGHIAAGFAVVASVAQLALLLLCAGTDAPFGWYVLAGTSAVVLSGLLTSAYQFRLWGGALRPRRSSVSKERGVDLMKEGGLLFVLALLGVLAFQTDILIIAHFLGSATVPAYALPFRIFGLVPLIAGLFLTPLWAAYRDGRERGRWHWIDRTFRISSLGAFGAALVTVAVLLPATPGLLALWVGDEVPTPSMDLRMALSSYVIVMVLSATVSVLLNALGVLRMQVVLGLMMTVGNLMLSVVLVQTMGISGPVWATVITQSAVVLIPSLYLARTSIRRHTQPGERAAV
ncbi:MAG: lipopolysaccharide biosynthesis protein [Actinomycetes bacterium]